MYLKHIGLLWLRTQLYRADEKWYLQVSNEVMSDKWKKCVIGKKNRGNKVVVLQELGLFGERNNKESSIPATLDYLENFKVRLRTQSG